MPRKNNLLPFLSIEKDGRAVYTRRLKPEMAQRVGQKIFKRRIGKHKREASDKRAKVLATSHKVVGETMIPCFQIEFFMG